MTAEITVIVPTLNSARTLAWTLQSLVNQRGIRLDVLVVDGQSSDETITICKNFGVPVIQDPPGNMYKSVNVGLRDLNTPWLTYLNSDDMVYPDSYCRLCRKGTSDDADIVYGYCDYVDWANRFVFCLNPPHPRHVRSVMKWGTLPFCQPATVFRRDTFVSLGGFDELFSYSADYQFFKKAADGGRRFARVDLPPVAAFRLHGAQLSLRQEAMAEGKSPHLGRTIGDWMAWGGWKVGNCGQYAERVWRRWVLERRLRLPRTLDTPVTTGVK